MAAEHIAEALAAPSKARTRAEWDKAHDAIKALCASDPTAQQIAKVKLPFYGGYTALQAIGPGGVLAIAAAVSTRPSEARSDGDQRG